MTGGKRLLAGPLLLLLPGFQRGDAFGVSFASRPPVLVGSSEPSSIGRVRLSSSTRRARHSPGYRGSVDSTSRPSGHRSDFSLPEMAWNKYAAPTTAQAELSMDINRGGASRQSGLKCLKSIAKPKADGNRGNNGSRHGGGGGGSSSSGGGSGRGGRRWSRQDGASEGAAAAMVASSGGNGTALAWMRASSASSKNDVEVDEGVVRRSPLVKTLAPLVGFLRSRAGSYGAMLGYVAFTLSQHITPAYLGVSFLAFIGPESARSIVVIGAQSLSLLTVASYIQDQFRHQVYPLPAVVSGPSAPYAVITGGSSGIGREIANELAGRGYNLLLVARGKEGLNTAAKELMEASREAVEAARREHKAGSSKTNSKADARREGRRERERRLRDERKETKRRMAMQSAGDSESPVGHPEDSSAPNSPVDYALAPQTVEQNVGRKMGLKDSSPSPHLSKAITARWFAADLSNSTAAAAVFDEVKRLNISVEILVNSAGICRVGRVDSLDEEDVMAQLQLNVAGTTSITHPFAKEFVRRQRGRIMIVSSITAASPNPSVAVYAASKSYLSSFAEALHSELESSGVGVTCVMPSATRTAFEDNSGSAEALVWRLPMLCMEADEVAARAVEALMRGDRALIPGWINKLYVHAVGPLVPRKMKMSLLEAIWQ
ncbi:unnamed protein product [Ascophyllum nodosum]